MTVCVALAGLGMTCFTLGYAPGWLSSLFSRFAEMD